MRKIVIMFIALSSLAIFATGCTSFETNRSGAPVNVVMNVEVTPDVEIAQKRVVGKATAKCLFGLITWGVENQAIGVNYSGEGAPVGLFSGIDPAANAAKNGAAFSACSRAKADLLLAPRYNLRINNYFVYKTIECTVSGYPGILKSIKIKK